MSKKHITPSDMLINKIPTKEVLELIVNTTKIRESRRTQIKVVKRSKHQKNLVRLFDFGLIFNLASSI